MGFTYDMVPGIIKLNITVLYMGPWTLEHVIPLVPEDIVVSLLSSIGWRDFCAVVQIIARLRRNQI